MSSFRSAILALLNMCTCYCPLATVEAPTKSAPGNDKSSGPRVCNTSSDIAVIAVLLLLRFRSFDVERTATGVIVLDFSNFLSMQRQSCMAQHILSDLSPQRTPIV
jgi:hypothetical protein